MLFAEQLEEPDHAALLPYFLYTKDLFGVMHVEGAGCPVLPNWCCQASLCQLVSQSDRITQSTGRRGAADSPSEASEKKEAG